MGELVCGMPDDWSALGTPARWYRLSEYLDDAPVPISAGPSPDAGVIDTLPATTPCVLARVAPGEPWAGLDDAGWLPAWVLDEDAPGCPGP